MSRIRLHFDEDAMQRALIDSLRARRVDVLTPLDCGLIGKSNLLHKHWITSGQEHSGIILASQQRYSGGEQLRRLLHLMNGRSAAEMLSRLEYLSNWGR